MVCKNRKKIVILSGGILLAALYSSCQTAPALPDAVTEYSGTLPLEPGASVYIVADVQNARPVLNNFNFIDMRDPQVQQMLDKTTSAVAAIYAANGTNAGTAGSYRLAAWGEYPASRAKMALGLSKDWKKRRSKVSGGAYWYSKAAGLAVALNAGQALVAADVKNAPVPADPFSAESTPVPEGFGEFRQGSVLSGWIVKPGPAINQKLAATGIPLEIPAEQLFIGLVPVAEDRYTARVRIQVAVDSQAKALTFLFSVARGFIPPDTSADGSMALAALLFANPPVQDGKNLDITTDVLSGEKVALLFNIFSLE